MITHTKVETGAVIKLKGSNDMYWGTERADAEITVKKYGPVDRADIVDPKYCKKPTDNTWHRENDYNPDIRDLENGEIKRIIITTVYQVED